jgi:hypothetical protein
MKISKAHQEFSDYLKEPKALTNPEDYLGPNWEDVINFWLYVDTLSWDEKKAMGDKYWDLDFGSREYAWNAAWSSAGGCAGWDVLNASYATTFGVTSRIVFGRAIVELIASHKLLEQGKTLVALPLCLKP